MEAEVVRIFRSSMDESKEGFETQVPKFVSTTPSAPEINLCPIGIDLKYAALSKFLNFLWSEERIFR